MILNSKSLLENAGRGRARLLPSLAESACGSGAAGALPSRSSAGASPYLGVAGASAYRAEIRASAAFTMVEMVGVLAVIAILASLLTPKIFSAINEARVSAAVGSLDAVKAATVSYYSKNGALPTNSTFDSLLVSLEFLERPFNCKLGNGDAVTGTGGQGGPSSGGYKLDGATNMTAAAAVTVECVISNVAIVDAWALSLLMDGPDLSATTAVGTNDLRGRVEYSHTSGSGNVYIYLGHR